MKQSVFPLSAHPKLFWTTTNIVPTGTINHFPSKKREAEHEVNHTPPTSSNVKNVCSTCDPKVRYLGFASHLDTSMKHWGT